MWSNRSIHRFLLVLHTVVSCGLFAQLGCGGRPVVADGGASTASDVDGASGIRSDSASRDSFGQDSFGDGMQSFDTRYDGDSGLSDTRADGSGQMDGGTEMDAGDALDSSPDALSFSGARCGQTIPAGLPQAPLPPSYSEGLCPTLGAGQNQLSSFGSNRALTLVLPDAPQADERFPVVFFWHWLNGTADAFIALAQLQALADQMRFIAVVPESKGDLTFDLILGEVDIPWPFLIDLFHSEARLNEEVRFFDDMLSCVSQQFAVDKECVSSVGVSAGALFTAQLAGRRASHLASFVSLSGGVGGGDLVNDLVRRWVAPSRALPALVVWGGPEDRCLGFNFDDASQELEAELAGHFFVECEHDCRHGDFPGDADRFLPVWDFILDHPFWLPAGQSPYLTDGLSASYPNWCGIGAEGAVPRSTGNCAAPSCPF